MIFNTADEVFSKLYSEQRDATPGEISAEMGQRKAAGTGFKSLLHPSKRREYKRGLKAKGWSAYRTDETEKLVGVKGKEDWTGIGFKEGQHYRQVKKPGTGHLL